MSTNGVDNEILGGRPKGIQAYRSNISGVGLLCVWVAGTIAFPGCSVKQMAINQLGDALASGSSVFTSDEDPELVRQAIPFSLKLIESLLEESPNHEGLLLAAASGFTQYAYAFIQQEGERLMDKDTARAMRELARGRKMYLRAYGYALRGLELRHTGFVAELERDAVNAVARTSAHEVAYLYWSAASLAAAISLGKDMPELVAQLPKVDALIDRALLLDEEFDDGAIHAFLITYEMGRSPSHENPAAQSRRHFQRAHELTRGLHAGPLVSLAESVSLQEQNYAEFCALLQQALAIDPDSHSAWRLVNLIMQERARWLIDRSDELFLLPESNPLSPY